MRTLGYSGMGRLSAPAYARAVQIDLTVDDDKEIIGASLNMVLKVLEMIDGRYRKGSVYLTEPVVKQAMLAAHLLPDKKRFSTWLSGMVKRTATTFPRTAEYDEDSGIYDASHERPVPRDFFLDEFEYSETAADEAWRTFLAGLNPGENPYLCNSEEMKAEGFAQTPYVL